MTHEGKLLQLYQLPEKARWTHKIPGLRSHSLVSVVKLCNAGCEVNFTKIGCKITYRRGRTIVCGRKCVRSGLWMIPITSVPRNREMFNEREANSVQGMEEIAAALETTPGFLANMQQVRDSMSKAELALFYHQCLGSPAKATLLKAIRVINYYLSLDLRAS